MIASRGMGDIDPSKMPKGKKKARRDDTDFTQYKKGGRVKKFAGAEESLVEKTKADTQNEGTDQRPSREELATGKFKQRAMNVAQMPEGVQFNPGFAQLSKGAQAVGGRGAYNKKLDKNTLLELYADLNLRKDQEGIRGRAPNVGATLTRSFNKGGKTKSKVNEAGNYTKPELRKRIFNSVKAAAIVGTGAGQWSARKAQVMAKRYKAAGGGYRD
jgi:hypothetical protein